jgi:hypothetical protein
MLRTACGRIAFLYTSGTEWKNLFSFDYSVRQARDFVLGDSYRTERLEHYDMLSAMVRWRSPL